jgi:hypothetical protein
MGAMVAMDAMVVSVLTEVGGGDVLSSKLTDLARARPRKSNGRHT